MVLTGLVFDALLIASRLAWCPSISRMSGESCVFVCAWKRARRLPLYCGLKSELYISLTTIICLVLLWARVVLIRRSEWVTVCSQASGGLRMITSSNTCSLWSLYLLTKWIPSCCSWQIKDNYPELHRQCLPTGHYSGQTLPSVQQVVFAFFMYTQIMA